MQNPAEAAATVSGAKETDGLTLAAEVEEKGTVSLLEGADEKDYYVRLTLHCCGCCWFWFCLCFYLILAHQS